VRKRGDDPVHQGEQQGQRGQADDQRRQHQRLRHRVADRLARIRRDGFLSAGEAGSDQGDGGRLRDQRDATDDADEVALQQEVGAAAEQDGGREGEGEDHDALPTSPAARPVVGNGSSFASLRRRWRAGAAAR
jgi:hypothetical protein